MNSVARVLWKKKSNRQITKRVEQHDFFDFLVCECACLQIINFRVIRFNIIEISERGWKCRVLHANVFYFQVFGWFMFDDNGHEFNGSFRKFYIRFGRKKFHDRLNFVRNFPSY